MHIVFPSDILCIQEMKFDYDSVNFFYAEQKMIRIFLEKFYGLMNVHLQIMSNKHNEHTWTAKNPRLRRDTHNRIRFNINI